tara:strand:- start:248 stop:637 length:390 start_codon:yes stop_codon:yes gene_type:complete
VHLASLGAEAIIDFENMVEAAGQHDHVNYLDDLDDFEKIENEISKEDADLKPILIEQQEIKFEEGDTETTYLGSGGFEAMTVATYRNHKVAVKKMVVDDDEDEDEEELEEKLMKFRRECLMMKELKVSE